MDVLKRAEELKKRVEAYNSRQAIQGAMYEKFKEDLAKMGLTPETLEAKKQELERQLEEMSAELDEVLNEIEERLDGRK